MKHIFSLSSLLKTSSTSTRSLPIIHERHSQRRGTPESVSPDVPPHTSHISTDWTTKLPGFPPRPPSSPCSYFFSSRLICQRVSPSHHSVWQADYLWVVSHSAASLQPSSPAGRDTPCNTAVTLQVKRGPVSPASGEAWEEYLSWLRSRSSHVVISIATIGCKVNSNCRGEVWPWLWRVYFCFNQMLHSLAPWTTTVTLPSAARRLKSNDFLVPFCQK